MRPILMISSGSRRNTLFSSAFPLENQEEFDEAGKGGVLEKVRINNGFISLDVASG